MSDHSAATGRGMYNSGKMDKDKVNGKDKCNDRDRLLIVGAGGFGRVVCEHASRIYDCAFADDGFNAGDNVCGIPVAGHISDLAALRDKFSMLIVAIGNNTFREKIYKNASELGYTFPNIIGPGVYISPFAEIGWGCVLLNNAVVQNGSSVGNGVLLNPGVEIHHDSFVDDYALIYTNSVVRTYARVGKRVRIGSNVTVGNDVSIPDDSDIENGSALSQNKQPG